MTIFKIGLVVVRHLGFHYFFKFSHSAIITVSDFAFEHLLSC